MTRSLPFDVTGLGRTAIVYATILLAFAVMMVRWHIPFSGEIKPPFVLMTLFAWWLYQPRIAGVVTTFLAGIGVDLLLPTPLGLHAATYLVLYALIRRQRRFLGGQSYAMFIVGFLLVAFIGLSVPWGVLSVQHGTVLPVAPLAGQLILSIVIFPLVLAALSLVNRLCERL